MAGGNGGPDQELAVVISDHFEAFNSPVRSHVSCVSYLPAGFGATYHARQS
jgi:hypothetical protein